MGSGGSNPPVQSGPRVTEVLSRRGARALQDASYKATAEGHGFSAHWTFTTRPSTRFALSRGWLTLSGEMRRTLNILQEWNRRHGEPPLRYEWVAENPGGTNPHVHLNTDFTVPRKQFREYAVYVERSWSHGMVHIERIREPRAAAAYLLKAVGYVAKGVQGGQGVIVGQRYGISSSLRSQVTKEVETPDEDGSLWRGVVAVCGIPGAGTSVDLGRGVYATRYGVGVRPLSGGAVADVMAVLAAHGGVVSVERIPDADPRFAWCRSYTEECWRRLDRELGGSECEHCSSVVV